MQSLQGASDQRNSLLLIMSAAEPNVVQGRNPLHRFVPFGARVFIRKRLRDWRDFRSADRIARIRGKSSEYPILVSQKSSPLKREVAGGLSSNTEEKTQNLRLGSARLNGLIIGPGEVFSFNRTIGPSTRRRGYLPALEFRDGEAVIAVGGGLCQLSDRTAPFGCGATVFYNYVDLRLRNTLKFPLLLETAVEPPLCRAALRSAIPMPFQCKMIETDHEFVTVSGVVRRRNKLWREYEDESGTRRELICDNDCRVVYPAEHLVTREEP